MANTRKNGRTRFVIGIAAFVIVIFIWLFYQNRTNRVALGSIKESTYPVAKQDMTISVLEGGSIKASKAVTIRSEVEGRTTIVNIIPEGTILTEEDVKKGTIILELDTSGTKEDLNRQQIAYNSAMADLTDAKESLDIQKNQNASDVQQARLDVKFAMMDLQKYMGQVTADKLIADVNETSLNDAYFVDLFDDPNQLGGESLQKYRQLTSDIKLAQAEEFLAQSTLGWTEKLAAKNYVAKTQLESDQLKADKTRIAYEQSQTAIELFIRYEFPKQAQTLFSAFVESNRQLERVIAKTRSQLAQAEAKLSSADAKYTLEKERLEKLQRQMAASIVKAPCPGMVVYATQSSRFSSRSRTSIEIGRELYEREEIMSIPSVSDVVVDTKVHETNVDKIVIGQKCKITVDAMPDTIFWGEVLKIAPLPDPTSFLSNPDLKLYATDVSLVGGQMLRPGMSAKVEILIAELKNVIAVPLQCVSNRAGKKICYIQTSSGNKEQEVKIGSYNDKFVQITDGLKVGERLLLNPPRNYEQPKKDSKSSDSDESSGIQNGDQTGMENQSPRQQKNDNQANPDRSSQRARPANSGDINNPQNGTGQPRQRPSGEGKRPPMANPSDRNSVPREQQ